MVGAKEKVGRLLAEAGIRIDGGRPSDIQVHDSRFYRRLLLQGSLGCGESYMDGWWDCERLDELFYKVFRARLNAKIHRSLRTMLYLLNAAIINVNRPTKAFEIGKRHYDIGNDLYIRMLDRRMTYSCGYWKDAKTLDEAQEAKLELTCRKLGLKQGMTLLDIGCGWGSLVEYAARKHKVRAVGITVSKEQARLARERCKGLPVTIRLQDYRDVEGTFDRIVSIGMFEHVGVKNYRAYMEMAHRCLKDNGVLLLHTIGMNTSTIANDRWIEKYIFPNAMLPSIKQIGKAIEGLFVMEDWHNFGADYDKTLMAWWRNFERRWPEIAGKYGERFYRMWRFYLLSCAGNFRARRLQLWQVVLSKQGVPGGYASLR